MAGSAVAMPVQSLGNAGYFGDPLLSPEEYLTGVAVGAFVGGAVNGSIATLKGNNFWNGQLRSSGLPRPQLLPSRINAELPKAELAGQPVKSLAPDIPSGQTMEPLQRQVIPLNAEMGGVNATKGGTELFKFGSKAAEHMVNPLRKVPIQILDEVIKNTKGLPDLRGSNALMYYSTIVKNGRMYNLEILYDKASNSIWHFKYTPKALGFLPAIK